MYKSIPTVTADNVTPIIGEHTHTHTNTGIEKHIHIDTSATENNLPHADHHIPPNDLKRQNTQFMKNRIEVEMHTVNLGVDIKFEDDPFNTTLYGIMSGEDYGTSIKKINYALLECRATKIDHALLLMGPMMLPLIPWSMRNKEKKKLRRKIMTQCVEEFNRDYPHLMMRWEKRPVKRLTIMKLKDAIEEMNK